MIVAAMPTAVEDTDSFAKLSNALREFCEQRMIVFVELASMLGSPMRREYLLPADMVYPTENGTRLIAEKLLPVITEALNKR